MAGEEGGVGLNPPAASVGAISPARYFESLNEDFEAAAEADHHETTIEIAGRLVRMRFAGARALDAFYPALSHLAAADREPADVEFCIWDGALSQRPLPELFWGTEAPSEGAVIHALCDESVRTKLDARSSSLLCYDRSSRRLMCCTRDASAIPWEVRSSPLVTAFGWAFGESMPLVHGGCVGRDGLGVLVTGPSGSGKSTTSLACAAAGLDYVSDDYVLVEHGPAPVAHGLTCWARVHERDLRRIDGLERLVIGWVQETPPKAVVDVRRLAPGRIRPALKLRALVIPKPVAGAATTARRVSAAEALRVMAPSSLILLGAEDPGAALSTMGTVARALPTYVLELGDDAETAAREVSRLCGDG